MSKQSPKPDFQPTLTGSTVTILSGASYIWNGEGSMGGAWGGVPWDPLHTAQGQ